MGSVREARGCTEGKRVLIACAMIEDELRAAFDATGATFDEIMWVERGFHRYPSRLKAELQRLIDVAERGGADCIVLAFGLCGGSADGLHSERATVVMPRFDDCVNFMLETGHRCCRGQARAGVFYLTQGWSHDSDQNPLAMRQDYIERFGQKKADRLMEVMFGAYRSVTLIENGCYEPEAVMPYAHGAAEALGVGVNSVEGSNVILEKLLSGDWDDDILVREPGRGVCLFDFEYALNR